MDFLYRLLGLCASVANSAHRQRRNHIPLSIVPFIGWIFLPVFLLGWLLDMGESKTPTSVPVTEIVAANEAAPHRFVKLQGRYHPDFKHGPPFAAGTPTPATACGKPWC